MRSSKKTFIGSRFTVYGSRSSQKGQSVVAFALVLPLVVLLILVVVGIAFMSMRGIVAQAAAEKGARQVSTFATAGLAGERFALNLPAFFRGGIAEVALPGDDGRARRSNAEEGRIQLDALADTILNVRALRAGRVVRRASPVIPAMERGLSDAHLQEGDTPSAYCREGEGYRRCRRLR